MGVMGGDAGNGSRGKKADTDPGEFPRLGVEVHDGGVYVTERVELEPATTMRPAVWRWESKRIGDLTGAEARLTDGSQAWSPGRAVFLPVALTGLATKSKATAFVIFSNGTYHERNLNGNAAVRDAQAEAVRFNLLAGKPAAPAQQQDDTAAILRKLASLHDEGLLSDEEFAAKRAEVIARI